MQDTDPVINPQHTLREDVAAGMPQTAPTQAKKNAGASAQAKPRGPIQRMFAFIGYLFTGKRAAKKSSVLTAADRAAASRAAQMQPPVAFRGDTTSTLATPMSAYAGKPVEQAMRKRAEQQFQTMDISTATMN